MNKWLKISSITAIVLTVGAASTFGFASAQEPTDQEDGFRGRGRGEHRHGPVIEGMRETMKEAMAEALGVTVEDLEAAKADRTSIRDLAEAQGVDFAEVQAAMEAAHQEAVQEALAAGTITQEQADQMLERGFGKRGHGRHGGKGGLLRTEEARAEMKETLAGALGITVEELEAARESGQRLSEIAEANGVDMADVEATMKDAAKAQITQAVEDGTITQEQADQMIERLENSEGFKGFGRGKGRRGPGRSAPNDGDTNFQPFNSPQGGEA